MWQTDITYFLLCYRRLTLIAHVISLSFGIGSNSSAGQVVAQAVEGSFRDTDRIKELASKCDVVTMEIEHVNCDALELLESEGVKVQPASKTLRTVQDKYEQKIHMAKADVPMGAFVDAPTVDAVREAGANWGYPLMLKAKRLAYDGRGNAVVKSANHISTAFNLLGGSDLYVEKWVPFRKEIAIMVVRSSSGELATYPLVDTYQKDSICHTTITPANLLEKAMRSAIEIASKAVASLWGGGIFGVEMFLLSDDSILYNEIAPRPHNTGHYTYEACECDQFDNHLRAVLGLPLGSTKLRVGASLMLNVLGDGTYEGTEQALASAVSVPGAAIHWYGKGEPKKGRKMGHITFCGNSMAELQQRVLNSGLYVMGGWCDPALPNNKVNRCVEVGIIMGSDSDLPTMKPAADVLEELGVCYEVTIVSAHRTPERMFEYAKTASSRGLKCIIAGAGGAAHLPGMTAALTPLPVIGVPVKTSTLSGVDSLHSIVQMPKGIPVATVAIGNAMNAGLLAARMLGMSDYGLRERVSLHQNGQESAVMNKVDSISELGWKEFLSRKGDKSTVVGV